MVCAVNVVRGREEEGGERVYEREGEVNQRLQFSFHSQRLLIQAATDR